MTTGMVAEVRRATRRRTLVVALVLLAALVVVVTSALAVGSYAISPAEVLATLAGGGAPEQRLVIFQLRLPRIVLGLMVGAAFGLAGGLFQALLRNPLASPDIIGVSAGASAAAVGSLLVLGFSGLAVSGAALAGALLVAAANYALSWRSGLAGQRFVLVGIALAFLVHGIIGYLLTRADVRDAQGALLWLVGSLSGARWEDIGLLASCLAVLLPLVAVVRPRLEVLQLGDASAAGLGLRVGPTRVLILVVAVALVAVATASVGPVAFVAFVAAPVARRLVGGLALVPTALVGALLVVASDFAAQHLLDGVQVPVGIITGAVGAPYLLWLLATANRRAGA